METGDFQTTNGTEINSMSDNAKIILVGIQKKIQYLHSDYDNSGFLQLLLHEAGRLIKQSDKEAGMKIKGYSNELNFYLDGEEDNLVKFYHCKAEALVIIAKHLGK